ncbi:hypothetical protein GCM10027090_04300 [Sinomonas soli]
MLGTEALGHVRAELGARGARLVVACDRGVFCGGGGGGHGGAFLAGRGLVWRGLVWQEGRENGWAGKGAALR